MATDVVLTFNTNITKTLYTNNLSVLGNREFTNSIRVKTSGQGAVNLRMEPSVDGQETSIGYSNRVDARTTSAGDMWVSGLNCWSRVGYTIGTPI